ncbi:hypothetical protein KA047_00660 [Candidatus Saccharibacteria bacterium]|nr:hypothetical protein [Candidatus Saccharibacteria bacterium]
MKEILSLERLPRILIATVLFLTLVLSVIPKHVSAAQITSRSVTLSNSAGAGTGVTYTFNFTVPSATVLQSMQAQICTTASGSCTTPSGFVNSSSTLASQPTNLGDAAGWTVNTSTAGSLRISKSGNVAAPTGSQTVAFGAITNPTAQNTTFFARITTYSDAAWTTAVDSGVVAASTAQQISVSATVDETLTFCSGTSGVSTSSCSGATGSAVSLGTLTSSTTGSGTSQLGVGTNGSSGYAITVSGTTLTSGGNTITALSSQTASSVGGEQFGINLRDNATPNVGSDADGSGSGTPSANYNTVDQFRFVTADTIASKASAEQFRRFHVAYIANIDTATEAGTYSTTLTYIATATF